MNASHIQGVLLRSLPGTDERGVNGVWPERLETAHYRQKTQTMSIDILDI
jgi:hypothetical protein